MARKTAQLGQFANVFSMIPDWKAAQPCAIARFKRGNAVVLTAFGRERQQGAKGRNYQL